MSKMTQQELTHLVLEIRDNHLMHMKDDIDKMDRKIEKMDTRVWAILILLVSAVVIPSIFAVVQGNV
jgi:hypothetical protein